MGTDAQSLFFLILAGYKLFLDGHLNTLVALFLHNLNAYLRTQPYGAPQKYTAKPILVSVSFLTKCLCPEPKANNRRPNGLRIVVPN